VGSEGARERERERESERESKRASEGASERETERERERERELVCVREREREITGSRRGRCDEEGDVADRTPAARPGAQRRDSSRTPCVCTCVCGSNPPSFRVQSSLVCF